MIVTREAARIAGPRIRDGGGSIRSDDVDIKVDQTFTGNGSADAAHAVSGMAGRTGEAIIDVPGVFAETGIRHDLIWVMTLRA